MAFQFPIPKPPRTPTPPTPTKEAGDHDNRDNAHIHARNGSLPVGLGIYGAGRRNNSVVSFDANTLSPLSATFPPNQFGSMASPVPPSSGTSPAMRQDRGSLSASSPGTDGEVAKNPFNFKPQTYTMAPVAKSVCSTFTDKRGGQWLTVQTEHRPTSRT